LILTPALAVMLVACSGGAGASAPTSGASGSPSGAPTSGPSGSPAVSPDTGAIDHATGATDILLRYDEGGGFMMPAFTAAMTPHFTLYGDGTVLFRNPAQEIPPAQGSVSVMNPLRIAKLSEEQIQDLLAYALGEGGLAAGRPEYRNDMIADASTALFTFDAGGITKTVSVYALGLEMDGLPDGPARAAFGKLAKRLTTLDQGGAVPSTAYTPETYRVSLFEAPGVVAPDVRAWPWSDIAVTDFKPAADPNGLQFPQRTMTAADLDLLKVTDDAGGFQNLVITGPDGKPYTLAARPILPDETE